MRNQRSILFILLFVFLSTIFGYWAILHSTKYLIHVSFNVVPPLTSPDDILRIDDFEEALAELPTSPLDSFRLNCKRRKLHLIACALQVSREEDKDRFLELWLNEFPRSWNFIPRELLTLKIQDLDQALQKRKQVILELESEVDKLYAEVEPELQKIDVLSGELERAKSERTVRERQRDMIQQSLEGRSEEQKPIFQRKLAELNAQVEDLKGKVENIRNTRAKLEESVAKYLSQKELLETSKEALEKSLIRSSQLTSLSTQTDGDPWVRNPDRFTIRSSQITSPVVKKRKEELITWTTLLSMLVVGIILRFQKMPKKISSAEELARCTSYPVLGEIFLVRRR